MTALTPKQIHFLRHALGLTGRNKITNRNSYYAASWDADVWRELVAKGFAYEGTTDSVSTRFAASRRGFEAVQRKGEKLSPDEIKTMEKHEMEAKTT